jgi:hypothetical protein
MAIVGANELLKKISSQIDSQVPGFIREEGPQFVAFIKAYFEYMEQEGNAVNAARTLRDNKDIDRTVDSFVEYFRKEFMINIPSDVLADKRLLAKHIREFYRTRGSQESYKFLFRALFNQEIDFYYPGDDILRASDGRWLRETRLRISAPFSKNPRNFEGQKIQGATSGATAFVQDIVGTTALGIEVLDITIQNQVGTFIDGERVFRVDDPSNYATINAQVGSIVDIQVTDGGAWHHIGDSVRISGAGSTEDATGTVTEVDNKGAVTLKIAKNGSGYTKENSKVIISGGNGENFDAVVSSWKRQTITGLSINTDIIGRVKDVKLNSRFFVRGGANSATVSTKLSGTVTASNTSNTITGSGTLFDSQLNVGDIVRIPGVANTMRVHTVVSNTQFVSVFTPFQNVSGANVYVKFAGANIGSTLSTALTFSSSELYSVNTITINNPGTGYNLTLPTIRVVDDTIASLLIPDGYGNVYGNNAVIVANTAPGEIKKIKINTPGSNFARYDEATIVNETQGNNYITTSLASSNTSGSGITTYLRRQQTYAARGLPIPSGTVQFPGRYIDTKGFLSWNNRLQDNEYYQEFSYVIRVEELLTKYKEVVKTLLHPAGTKMFGDYNIRSTVNSAVQFVDSAPLIARRSVRERITATSTQNSAVNYANSNFAEAVSSATTQAATFIANTNITETVTVTVSDVATYIANTFATESVTTDHTQDVTYTANTFAAESITSTSTQDVTYTANTSRSESVLAVASHEATYTANTFDTETITVAATHQGQRFALMSGVYATVQYANTVIQAYATAQIAPYAQIPVGAFDGTPRLVTSGTGATFANGAITANTGSISVGGIGSNLYIITNPGTPDETSTIYNVNTIFSNTAFTIRTNFVPTSANTRIWYSTGP